MASALFVSFSFPFCGHNCRDIFLGKPHELATRFFLAARANLLMLRELWPDWSRSRSRSSWSSPGPTGPTADRVCLDSASHHITLHRIRWEWTAAADKSVYHVCNYMLKL